MKFLKQYKDGSEPFEVNEATALGTLLTAYKNNFETRQMLKHEGTYNCGFSYIIVKKEEKE